MKKNYIILKIIIGLMFFNISSVWAQTAEELVHLGNVNGKQEKYKEALLDYTKAIALVPNYANAYYNRGYVYIEIRKYKLAIHDFGLAIGINSKYTAAYHLLGVAYFSIKKYPEAIVCYGKAIELDPKNIKFYISRMSAYCKMGNNDKAWKDVIKIQKLGGVVNPAIINILKEKQYKE